MRAEDRRFVMMWCVPDSYGTISGDGSGQKRLRILRDDVIVLGSLSKEFLTHDVPCFTLAWIRQERFLASQEFRFKQLGYR